MKSFLCALAFAIFVSRGLAHDPGLSSAEVEIRQSEITATIGYNARDAASLGISQGGAPATLPGFELYVDGRRQVGTEAQPAADAQGNVDYRLVYPLVAGRQLTFRSALLGRLPFGHRQYLRIRDATGAVLGERLLSAGADSFDLALSLNPPSESPVSPTFSAFFLMGVRHILTGYDHLLFLGGLLLVCGGFRQAAGIITCFTLAHSVTLALATFQLVSIPSRIVEPAIAASIAYVGVENILRGGRVRWRWLLTLGFGLIHGLGFASALSDVGVGANGTGVVIPLLSFNLGVEAGQLSVAAVVLPIILLLRRRPRFVRIGIPAASLAIALAGGFWFFERTLGPV